jgi:hypothetical protein
VFIEVLVALEASCTAVYNDGLHANTPLQMDNWVLKEKRTFLVNSKNKKPRMAKKVIPHFGSIEFLKTQADS